MLKSGRLPFSGEQIQRNRVPRNPGIFILSNERECVTVEGKPDIRAGLEHYLGRPGSPVNLHAPTHFEYEELPIEEHQRTVDLLIQERNPVRQRTSPS